MIVKVCGVRTAEVAEAAVDAGADWIGLMLVPKSSRWVDDTAALSVVRAVGDRADLIGVFVEPTADACDEAASRYRLAGVQVHGTINHSLVMACSVPVIPVINVPDRTAANTMDWPPDTLVMLDGMPDHGALPGGTGHRVPLEWAADVARHREIVLAGGLGPDDVADAIYAVRPAGVDASSRLELRPGEKDPDLVRRFVHAARSAAANVRIDAR
jgi:phosphoribosylanthranilate isomerase